MTVFLVILAILLLGGTALVASGSSFPVVLRRRSAGSGVRPGESDGEDDDGESNEGGGRDGDDVASAGHVSQHGGEAVRYTSTSWDGVGLVEPVAGLPPVLLPDAPGAEDVDAVRFGLGLRGYRMDQVDEVLDRLAAALHERDALIRSLRSQLAAQPDVDR